MTPKSVLWPPHAPTCTQTNTHQENLQCLEHSQRRKLSNLDILAKAFPQRWAWTSILICLVWFSVLGLNPGPHSHWVTFLPCHTALSSSFSVSRNSEVPRTIRIYSCHSFSCRHSRKRDLWKERSKHLRRGAKGRADTAAVGSSRDLPVLKGTLKHTLCSQCCAGRSTGGSVQGSWYPLWARASKLNIFFTLQLTRGKTQKVQKSHPRFLR